MGWKDLELTETVLLFLPDRNAAPLQQLPQGDWRNTGRDFAPRPHAIFQQPIKAEALRSEPSSIGLRHSVTGSL
jgi:hypothetical protein